MVAHDNTYSLVVSWLKIILPLLALALPSTLFLVARTVDPRQTIPYADVDLDELAREARIGSPNFSGMTKDGAAVTVSARQASPDPNRQDVILGTGIDARLEGSDGVTFSFAANSLELDGPSNRAQLSDGVTLETSNGYSVGTEEMAVSLDWTHVVSKTRSTVTGPVGEISADGFEILKNPKNVKTVLQGNN